MKKRMLLFLLTFAFAVATAAYAEAPGYTDRSVKVLSGGKEAGELSLRFYDGTPNIPYMGMNEYAQFMGRQPSAFTRTGKGRANWKAGTAQS